MSGSLSVGECLVVIPMTTGFYFFFSWSSRENMREEKWWGEKNNKVREAVGSFREAVMEVQ